MQNLVDSPRTLLTVQEVAQRLGVSRASVYRLIEKGELPALRLGSSRLSHIRIDLAELEAWLYGDEAA